ncbi:MAG: ATP-binding cassette domain-containing protein [Clostridia bacterium]|nr:ATP-binding cassette domain-containing protein [Clostridia bacterium]
MVEPAVEAAVAAPVEETATKTVEEAEETAVTEVKESEPLDPEAILEVRNLKKYFPVQTDFFGRPTKYLKAVDDVSFKIKRGTTLGIVGESGCGKTTLGRTILRLQPATGGEIYFDGLDINTLKTKELNKLRPSMQIIFQDPYSSLSPRMPIGEIIGEAVAEHKLVPKSELKEYVLDIMKKCGLPHHYYERYPHEFSGGQRQRICIATALALQPKFVVCDEPVSALDVSIQAQIINLLKDLQEDMGLTYIFISHDLSVVEHISDYVGVMYLGSMVEYATTADIFDHPMHPYTEALFSAVPVPDPKVKMHRIILSGDIPSPINAPSGCKFHTRCSRCMDICKEVAPKFKDYGNGHMVACHLYSQDDETPAE